MLGVPACMPGTANELNVCRVSTSRCHRAPLYVPSSNLGKMGQAVSNVTSDPAKDPKEVQGDLQSAVKLASAVSDVSRNALPDAQQSSTQKAQETQKDADDYADARENKPGASQARAAPLSYSGSSFNNTVFKAVIPVDAVTVDGKAYEYGWALDAANLLRGSGPEIFAVRGLKTGDGRAALFARVFNSELDDAQSHGHSRASMTRAFRLVAPTDDDRAKVATGEIRTVPYDAVWIRVEDVMYDREKDAASACTMGVRAETISLLPDWQQVTLDRWVKSSAIADAVMQGTRPVTTVAATRPAHDFDDANESLRASSMGTEYVKVVAVDPAAGCFIVDDAVYPGKYRLLLRMDPERAAYHAAKSAKNAIVRALSAQRQSN